MKVSVKSHHEEIPLQASDGVMAYDEDCQLMLAEMTLMKRNVKAEGENFNTTTAKRARFSKP
ncbi:hypothetical protein C2G38_2168415 [Gigaspora rosea]|uniref:Uncharacterized protein n=1 Tax=Gigaspora rosea TaxID=44941 RepID=A0A397VT79_9GLOM|nr:hypothetical protein C2G38_2168415 [Gigaspora rosea]